MTERELVYSIIETLNNYEYNNDNRLNERLVRNLIHIYRPEAIRAYYKDSDNLSDECYQNLDIVLDSVSKVIFKGKIPHCIELGDRKGFYFSKIDISIPMVNNTVFLMASDNDLPLIRRNGNSYVEIKIPYQFDDYLNQDSQRSLISKILLSESRKNKIKLSMKAILVNPSDDVNYNWISDPFPFPAERLDELKTTILRKEFGIASQIKSDEVQNARVDNIRYHENTNLEQ